MQDVLLAAYALPHQFVQRLMLLCKQAKKMH